MAKPVIQRVRSKWSEIFIYAAIGLGPLGFMCSSSAQLATVRSAIEPSQVITAMRDGSLPTEGAQVKLAASVTSSVPVARIEVESVSVIGSHEVRMRLACVDRSECLPFFATAIYADAVDASKFRRGQLSQPSSAKNIVSEATSSGSPKSVETAKDTTLLRAGAPATLEIEAERIHVRIEVISLQNGAPGNRVRVSSLDHKQIYVAEVISPTLLKGELLQ